MLEDAAGIRRVVLACGTVDLYYDPQQCDSCPARGSLQHRQSTRTCVSA